MPVTGAFIVTGLISFLRLIRDLKTATPRPGWWSSALRGSLGWWVFTFALLGVLAEIAR